MDSISKYKTVKTHLLYNDIIESDFKIHREETFLGAVVATIVFVGGCIALYALAHYFGFI